MGWSESIDAMLLAKQRARVMHIGIGLIVLALIIDAAAALTLRLAPPIYGEPAPSWRWASLPTALADFESDTLDLIVLLLLRVPLLMLLGRVACVVGTPKLDGLDARSADAGSSVSPLLCVPISDALQGDGTPPAPLSNGAPVPPSNGAPVPLSHGTRAFAPSTVVKSEHLLSHRRKESAERAKNVVVAAIFLLSTVSQVYVGVKCISFRGEWEKSSGLMSLQGALMGLSVLMINIEAWLTKRLVNTLTAEPGFFVPEFHPHPLFFHKDLPNHRCDLCRNKVVHVYRCALCDFDCCPACFNKKDKATGEGVLRGDRGIKQSGNLTTSQYLARGLKLAAPQLPYFLLAMFCVLSTSSIRLFLPNFQGEIFDHVIAGTTACNPAAGFAPHAAAARCDSAKQAFLSTVLIYLVCSVALGFLGGLSSLCFNLIGRRIMVSVRETLFRSMVYQDIACFDGMRVGDLTQRLSGDVRAMVSPVTTTLSIFISNFLLLVGGVVMCFITSWQLSMVAYTTVLPIMHVTEAYAKWSGKINRQIYQHYSDATAQATEAFTNIRTVRALSTEKHEADKVAGYLAEGLRKGIRDAVFGAFTSAFNNYLDLGASVLLLWYGGSIAMSADPAITVGSLIKYQLYWNMINNSYQALNNLLNSFTRAAGAAERVLTLVELLPDIHPGGTLPADHLPCELELQGVVFRYQMRPLQTVLAGVSFRVPAGSVCALVGKSGGGKSTLVHLVLRFYDPLEGKITFGGEDYRNINLLSLHRQIGVVSQETQLFNASVAENIAYGTEDASEEEIYAAARAAQAHDFVSAFEDGYHTRVGERGQRLSGGQKQRISIARCLLRKPRLLLLDEATSALDAESESQVQAALDGLIWTGNHTVILVAHRLSTVVNAHKIVVIDQGLVAETGTHSELLEANGTYASLVAKQVQKSKETIAQ